VTYINNIRRYRESFLIGSVLGVQLDVFFLGYSIYLVVENAGDQWSDHTDYLR